MWRLRIVLGKVPAGTEGGWALGASVAGAAFLWLRVLWIDVTAVFKAMVLLRSGSRFAIPLTPDVRPRLIIAASPQFRFHQSSRAYV